MRKYVLLGEELLWSLEIFEYKQGFRVGVGGFFCHSLLVTCH